MPTTDNATLHRLYDEVRLPSKRFSGIVGDANHARDGGYHIGRAFQPSSNYSVGGSGVNVSRRDAGGDAYTSAGIDISFSPADMITATSRLYAAMRRGDPLVRGIREMNGTLDGRNTVNFDAVLGRQNYRPDDTHLWHVHIGFFRDTVNDWNVISGIATIINGGSSGSSAPASPAQDPIKINQEDSMRFPFIGGPNSPYPGAVFYASGGVITWVPSEGSWRNVVYAIGQENAITHPGVYATPVNFQNGRAVSTDFGSIPKVDDFAAFGRIVGPTPDNPRGVNTVERELLRRSDASTGRRPLGPGDVLLPGAPAYDVSRDGGKLRDRLGVDEKLLPGQTLWSADKSRQFTLQTDGSLALYDAAGYIWHAPGSTGKKVTGLVVQKDGSVVLYDDKGAVWNMNTFGKPVKELVVQNDANIVAVGADGTVFANTGTRCV